MPYSPILLVHIAGGTVGLLSGTAAIIFRKGSARHAWAGRVFVVAMLTMASLAVYIAVGRHEPSNIGGGILTFYLIGTAWLTARRRDGETSRLDWVVLLIPLTLGILTWMNGISIVRSGEGSPDGVPVGMTFFMGSVMLLAAAGGRSHAGRSRCCWSEAHRAASLAHVIRAIHRSRIFFSGAFQSATEIAVSGRLGTTSLAGVIQHERVPHSHPTSAGFAGVLARPSPLHGFL